MIKVEDELSVMLVVRSVIGVAVEDELRIRKGLRQVQGVHRVHDHIVIAVDHKRWLLDGLKVLEALPEWLPPL
jgi:hypothetical protein